MDMQLAAWLHDPTVWRVLGAATFVLYDHTTWSPQHYAFWTLLVIAAMELLARIAMGLGWFAGYGNAKDLIKNGGKPLDEFETIDLLYITFNKVCTAMFAYHAVRWVWTSPLVLWAPDKATLLNTVAALPLLYIVYDLPYTLFHRALHHRSVYAYVHKHHHRNNAPFRGNLDAINVHPLEFISGEYNHLLAAYTVAKGLQWCSNGTSGLHVGTVLAFVALGGLLASWNHTRYDIKIDLPTPWGRVPIFQVALHDLHHHQYVYNYAQYVVLWDWLFSSYKPYSAGKDKGTESTKLD